MMEDLSTNGKSYPAPSADTAWDFPATGLRVAGSSARAGAAARARRGRRRTRRFIGVAGFRGLFTNGK